MSHNAHEPTASDLFEIKAGYVNLLNLKLLGLDLDTLAAQLSEKIRSAPEFFRNAPVVIDLSGLGDPRLSIDFAALLPVLRNLGLSPAGVRGGRDAWQRAAERSGLAVLAEFRSGTQPKEAAGADGTSRAAASEPARNVAKLIDHPVRSGQRIYAPGGDLIVLAPVSPGAELMADGNIHIYSSLRGRALAGVQGDLESRIFCMDLQAELIAIGGQYQISENLEESIRGRPVQVFLRHDTLIIEDL
ncbi:MAG: septum site-determining protein MinC [Methylotetracoccus sp.]|jgi:septum site-determining protein MinC|nr:septum site-determining protein MinC [Methylotetracoccus sp.]